MLDANERTVAFKSGLPTRKRQMGSTSRSGARVHPLAERSPLLLSVALASRSRAAAIRSRGQIDSLQAWSRAIGGAGPGAIRTWQALDRRPEGPAARRRSQPRPGRGLPQRTLGLVQGDRWSWPRRDPDLAGPSTGVLEALQLGGAHNLDLGEGCGDPIVLD